MFITLAMSLYILVMYQCTIQKWFHVLFERSPYACVVSVGLREEIRSVEISVSSKWCTLKVLKIGKKVSHGDSYNRMALEIFKDLQPFTYAPTHLQLATGSLLMHFAAESFKCNHSYIPVTSSYQPVSKIETLFHNHAYQWSFLF